MAFRLPNFNLSCNIATPDIPLVAAIPTPPYRLVNVPCALVYGRRVNVVSTGGTTLAGVPLQCENLLLPAFTDIRGPQDNVSFDVVEVPSGTGRWYAVGFADDIGKGWANEHRSAALLAIVGAWIAPYA